MSEWGGAGGDKDIHAHDTASVVVGDVQLDAGVGAVEKAKDQKSDTGKQDGDHNKRTATKENSKVQRRHEKRH